MRQRTAKRKMECISDLFRNLSKNKKSLTVFIIDGEPKHESYLSLLKEASDETATELKTCRFFSDNTTTEKMYWAVADYSSRGNIGALLVMLPLPKHIDKDKVFSAIPQEKDIRRAIERIIEPC